MELLLKFTFTKIYPHKRCTIIVIELLFIVIELLFIADGTFTQIHRHKRCTTIVAEMRRGSLWLLWVFLLEVALAQVPSI